MAGQWALLFALAAVTGIGVPGPGDSALIAGGVIASAGNANLAAVLVVAFLGAVVGRGIGYRIGYVGGRPLMERPGRLQAFRLRTVAKGDALFERFPRVAPLIIPAAVAGIHRVKLPVFILATVVASLGWTLSTGLVAYFFGPAAKQILSDIGMKGGIAVIVIAGIGFLYRYLWQRRHPPQPALEAA